MGLIDKYHVDSKYIIFEITENTYIHNVEAVNRMIQHRADNTCSRHVWLLSLSENPALDRNVP